MINIVDPKVEEFHQILQKFINYTLFGTVDNPKFENDVQSVQMQDNIINFYQLLSIQTAEQRSNFIDSFFQESIINFQKLITGQNIIDLMNCYGSSVFRVTVYLINNIGQHNPKNLYDPNIKDNEILLKLMVGEEFPEEINAYLAMQFFDFFAYIPQKEKVINKELYKFLVNRYVCTYDYIKVTNIIYQNFDEID